MKINEYKTRFIQQLTPIYSQEEAQVFFFRILEHLKGLSRIELALQPEIELSMTEKETFDNFKAKLLDQQPIQYILGYTDFYGLKFKTTPSVLIPRPETEELVDWIVKEYRNRNNLQILDIGTGSGCIAISIAQNLKAEVTAFDISGEALDLAQHNADINESFVQWIEFDILSDLWEGNTFDVIVSNPPYVTMSEKSLMKPNVLEHEPHIALFVPDDNALIFYEKIAQFAQENLNPGGRVFFEINQYLAQEMLNMLQVRNFKNIELRKDIYGNNRMLSASL